MRRFFVPQIFSILVSAVILIGASVEFYHVAWGTGEAVGQFSPRWFVLFIAFVLTCAAVLAGVGFAVFRRKEFLSASQKFVTVRNKFTAVRLALAFLVLVVPVWFLQRTMWGIVFDGVYFRALLWALTVFLLSFFLTRGEPLIEWKPFLAALILTSSMFTIAVSLQGVTDYPFSQAWSEGNRIWDYSMRFGRDRYGLADDQDVYVLLDPGRMLVGGLPFLIPGVSIETVRLWIGLTLILPYFLVGLAAFIVADKNARIWLLMTLWVFLFLRQGPIHAPLVLAAALTVFLWRKPLWLAVPLIVYAGYFAQSSRFTWLFAPGLWIGMLELAGASLRDGRLDRAHWVRAIALGLSGAFGGYLLPKLIPLLNRPSAPAGVTDVTEQIASTGVNSEFIANAVTDQPLLWYRLLPNPTYGTGILLGLLIAVLPLAIFLLWLAAAKKWNVNIWQKLAIAGPLLAFLVVGLIASTKIGGGGDLHNMDMFLIGTAFTAFIAWVNGGKDVVLKNEMPSWVRVALAASLIVPAVTPLRQLRSFDYGDELNTLMVLTDTTDKKAFDMLPDTVTVESALQEIQAFVDEAQPRGGVLFMDQRQLLTFGYITVDSFVGEYEKKILMNEALSANYDYYQAFYRDIAAQRFSLIVTEPLRTPVKDATYEFGEENNAWVKWVSIPVLCYYQEVQTFKEVNVQLLVPKTVPDDCSEYLP
ncbi:MAG: hypothetical protein DPW18_02245 [Chloroflexi bacterium]|nr:hypothetical protein [Chloroflexota bacterium]MDL1942671.1 hypothetical protein [Chloroflexi bacterium CFX2]